MENIRFSDFNLSEEIKNALADMGFETPSPIQAEAIPLLLEGKDMIGQAQTGTGKTAAFGIPTLEGIDVQNRRVQALVLCPTRELALQVAEEFKKIAKYKKGIKICAVFGGASYDKQIQELRGGAQIVVGTPGRVIDHINRGTLKLENVNTIVLDEADEMLNMGFIDDIETILENMPEEGRQTIFFSATMPKPILELTKKFQKNPEYVKITKNELTVTNIEQSYYEVRSEHRTEAMCRLIELHGLKMMLVFCNTKKGVDELVEELQVRNLAAEGIHGDLRQTQRNNVLAKFKAGVVNMLIATDVAARGIDVKGVDAVFNYDLPLDEENYVHRIGRTGRAGREGKSFTFITGRKELLRLKDVQRYTKAEIKKQSIPTGEEIKQLKTVQFIEKVSNSVYTDELKEFYPMAEDLLAGGQSPKNILAALIKMHLGTFVSKSNNDDINYRLDAAGKDRNSREDHSSKDSSKKRFNHFGSEGKMAKLFVNIGKKHRIRPGDIVGAIAGEANISGSLIGDITIKEDFSFVYVPKDVAYKVLEAMSGNKIKGNKVNVEMAKA